MDFLLGVPGKLTTIDGKVDTVDSNVDAILVDTGTTLPATLSTISSNVSAILTDTGTTLDGKINTIDTNVDAILVDTGTTLPATLSTIEGKIDTIDTNVDALVAAGSSINSIQRGVVTGGTSGSPPFTVTISAVNTSKSFVICNNDYASGVSSQVTLTNSTTLTIYNNYYSDPTWYKATTSWQVVEFN